MKSSQTFGINNKNTQNKKTMVVSTEILSDIEIQSIVHSVRGEVVDIHDQDEHLKDLENYMNSQIIGQEKGIAHIMKVLDMGLNNLNFGEGSLGCIFLGGPTGSGKTETVKELANYLLGDKDGFINVECEKYQEAHSQSGFFGTQDGYVGFGTQKPLHTVGKHYEKAMKAGTVHELIRNKPGFTIIFLDEIEKAHFNFKQSTLSLIEKGKTEVTVSKGKNEFDTKNIDLSNTLFVFASNIGQHEISQLQSRASVGFIPQDDESLKKEADEILDKEFRKNFSPEFCSRAGDPVVYDAITQASVRGIILKLLGNMNNEIQKYFVNTDIQVGLSDAACQFIEEKGFDAKSGAREIKRTMKSEIASPVFKIIDTYADTQNFQKHHKNIIYFDVSEDGIFLEPKVHHLANHSPIVELIEAETENEEVDKKVLNILKKSGFIQTFHDQLHELGFSVDDIDILTQLDRDMISSEILRVEIDKGIELNMYTEAEGIFEGHNLRDFRKLIDRMGKTILDRKKYSKETFILALIVKSIATVVNVLDVDGLSIGQREVIARFAIVSALKIW